MNPLLKWSLVAVLYKIVQMSYTSKDYNGKMLLFPLTDNNNNLCIYIIDTVWLIRE